jgi:hypothetical protein
VSDQAFGRDELVDGRTANESPMAILAWSVSSSLIPVIARGEMRSRPARCSLASNASVEACASRTGGCASFRRRTISPMAIVAGAEIIRTG